ncbi:MAG: cell envelope biogenesis protein LolA [Xanthomarina sp.]|uniref:LolA family protein n=2 Tax=Xanthomarina sp. TaxID=1931211 RepID=UPI000C566DED|nr:outer membrane lipoprotein carrier protein LolA [Xanthomarina sp.]MAL21809.1 cell envelope biogenesis protein LolA [Xanthomarina sp.]MBF62164.1 cell envelope biogenesis protein LolA [Xanthomarina sp.]HAB28671.1 cell envelope biogenesis protein LolA [Xanthomarina gelatinilytica]HAI19150.1 cell envelope biogenesis protein LolA [Xanthomarina gelatinilytica]|tara:strand:- start:1969 stop:2586 length:618 start_codon:yes stop_codon:yes gene_type:complete
MRNLVFLFLLLSVTMQAQTKMSATEAQSLKTLVKRQALTTKTIVSDFTQYKHLDFLSNDIITKGKLAFKTPDLVKWEYTEPYKYAVLFKNETLFINDEGKKNQVDMGSNKLFKELNNLIINSIKGDMFDEDAFVITYFKTGKNSEVHFVPKDKNSSKYIETFQITFNPSGDVTEVKMMEPSGDYTKIVFTNKELNKPLPDAIFTH